MPTCSLDVQRKRTRRILPTAIHSCAMVCILYLIEVVDERLGLVDGGGRRLERRASCVGPPGYVGRRRKDWGALLLTINCWLEGSG